MKMEYKSTLILYKKKLCRVIEFFAMAYVVVTVGTALLAVVNGGNKGVAAQANSKLREKSCESQYEYKNYNPLNPIGFYLNYTYWTSDYRVSRKIFMDDRCYIAIREISMSYEIPINVAVVDGNGSVMSLLKFNK